VITTVAFDYGKVLSGPQKADRVAELQRLTGIPPDEFESYYRTDRLAYDRADLTGREYWTNILSRRGAPIRDDLITQLIAADVASWLGRDEAMLAWTERLAAAGVRLAVLSNMPVDVRGPLVQTHGSWLARFEHTIFSCDVKCVKPDAAIYELLLAQLRVPAGEVLFIDDHPGNVAGAKAVGLHTIHFSTYAALAAEPMQEWGLVI